MKKRFINIVAAVLVLAIALMSFAGCSSGKKKKTSKLPQDTFFKGSVSEVSYNDPEACAKGFLAEEMNGVATNTTFQSYKKDKDLTRDEINKLPLGDIDPADVQAAEEGTVSYTESTPGVVTGYATTLKTRKIIIIRLAEKYHYGVPAMDNGDMITKSYMDAVLDPQKYINFTATSDQTSKSTMSMSGYSINATATSSGIVKTDGNATYMTLKMTSNALGTTATEMDYEIYGV